jgi:hypothetical protein
MKTRNRTMGVVLLVGIAAVLIGLNLKDRWNLSQRRHQIESLWSAARIYYAPEHHDRMPSDLEELRPIFQSRGAEAFFDSASKSVVLVSPGASVSAPSPTVFIRERQPDARGRFWVHDLDGSINLKHASR